MPTRCNVWPIRLAGVALLAGCGPVLAAPSTFGSVVGNAVLCLDHVDTAYFRNYLSSSFGPAYKHEGGAWWFTVDAILWGIAVTDVLVGDDSSNAGFVAAVVDAAPDKLDEAIIAATGLHHVKTDASAFPLRRSGPGSKIVYFNNQSKIYCDRYQALAPSPR